jgi:hypothetical protein
LTLAFAAVTRLWVSEAEQSVRSDLPGDGELPAFAGLEVLFDNAQQMA